MTTPTLMEKRSHYERVLNGLVFEPVRAYQSCGNQIQIARTSYQGIEITERTFFPWNLLKSSTCIYIPDLIIQQDSDLARVIESIGPDKAALTDKYYTEEGYAMVECFHLETCLQIIDAFKTPSTPAMAPTSPG